MCRCLEVRGYIKKICTPPGKRSAQPKMCRKMWCEARGMVLGGLMLGVELRVAKMTQSKEKPQ